MNTERAREYEKETEMEIEIMCMSEKKKQAIYQDKSVTGSCGLISLCVRVCVPLLTLFVCKCQICLSLLFCSLFCYCAPYT